MRDEANATPEWFIPVLLFLGVLDCERLDSYSDLVSLGVLAVQFLFLFFLCVLGGSIVVQMSWRFVFV
jgi:hypothetical protein